MHITAAILIFAISTSYVCTRDVPSNVWNFYNRIKNGKCTGGSVLQYGFYSLDGGSKSFAYCRDNTTGVIYLHGNNDLFANMDVDCDGLQSEGDCSSDSDTQSETRWKDQVQEYSVLTDAPVDDLDANKIPYVVFGNECEGDCPEGFNTFDPRKYGVQPLSVMAVLCNNQLLYGVWGDTNGDDDTNPVVGEASISLARACFPDEDISPDSGHDHDDVLYVAFPGTENGTVFKHANWSAPDFDEFEDSISWLGDQLVQKLV